MGSSHGCPGCRQENGQAETIQASKAAGCEAATEVFGPVTSFHSTFHTSHSTLSSPESPHNVECKFSRLELMAHLDVDEQVLRGIPLHTLRIGRGGRWSCPNKMSHERKEALYEESSPTQHFDIFFSHTWLTSGTRKYVALLFHNGWPVMVTSWFFAAAVLGILCLTDFLPMPFIYQATILDYQQTSPMGCWVVALTLPVAGAALVLAPYCPKLGKHSICFVDMFSIHQTDSKLRERGIYGIGGCLQRSKELRLLWSPPYFSRLWCMFELAAYRFANPRGKITMAPIFVEFVVLTLLVGILVSMTVSWVGAGAISQGNRAVHLNVALLFLCLPLSGIIHVLRKQIRAKRQLILDLESFTLDRAECQSDFDRRFINSAIDEWYGSAEAFANYVRGPLRTELLQNTASTVPTAYVMTFVICALSVKVEFCLAIVKGGAPLRFILAAVGRAVGTTVYQLACFKLMIQLAEQFAEPRNAGILDLLQTFLIGLATWLLLLLGHPIILTLQPNPGVLPLSLLVVFQCLVFLASFGAGPLWRSLRHVCGSSNHTCAES